MDNKEFKKIIENCLSKYDFVYKNKNYYYYDKLVIVINCQKSNYENAYYINYGFWVKEIHEEEKYPLLEMCDVMGRFNYIINDKVEYNFRMDTLDKNNLEENIKRNITHLIVPVIENGIEKYFEIYPQAICAAKMTLKNYLGRV